MTLDRNSSMDVQTKTPSRSIVMPRLSRRAKQDFEGWLFISPVVVGVLAFYFVPILVSLYTSFTNADGLTQRDWIGLFNYDRLLTRDDAFRETITNTLYYVLGQGAIHIRVRREGI